MRFLADERIDISAVEALKRIGVDVSSVQELVCEARATF
ncbi:MAG: DUF5615 family PIN-like protein [Halobacteriota archaeon]